MMVVGLTGGIGSGKSTVAKMFKELGVPVYDSDDEAKKLMVTSPSVITAIKNLLGGNAYDKQGLNRRFIAKKVFNDPELLKKLNAIVHPAVRDHFLEWAKRQESAYVIQETALIFENKAQNNYDYTILVTAPLNERMQRVVKRDGVNPEDVLSRIKNQMQDEEKIGLANFCIENVDLDTTEAKVKELHAKLLAVTSKF